MKNTACGSVEYAGIRVVILLHRKVQVQKKFPEEKESIILYLSFMFSLSFIEDGNDIDSSAET